jgi:hypothetical protein
MASFHVSSSGKRRGAYLGIRNPHRKGLTDLIHLLSGNLDAQQVGQRLANDGNAVAERVFRRLCVHSRKDVAFFGGEHGPDRDTLLMSSHDLARPLHVRQFPADLLTDQLVPLLFLGRRRPDDSLTHHGMSPPGFRG